MLALEKPARQCAVVVVSDLPGLPSGTVLYVEGYSATRHESIRAWLASDASTVAMINNMIPEKYRGGVA